MSVWIRLDFASVFHMAFVYSRKKRQWQKSEKKKYQKSYLPTYPIFFEHVTPVLYPDAFPYCWISISNKYVKQLVLINHSWISPTLQKGWELELCLFFKKWARVHFSPKKGEVGKIIEEWRLQKENNLCLLAGLNPRNITIPGIYIKVTNFIIYPNFWDKVLSKM